ncbi:hypothetical protein DSO57_1009073 [Entomophthora muscae]|uniref:Uncharacterized protein n=1 Tax=Entomophthora muscae TaxID=34485 RepID=A0ACC2RLR7_9FUNG|nr:hypothetical protein DSO57_1009073 [Entomophthora muscae]
MQVHTQEGDGREEFNSDTELTQLVQGTQAARVQSINPQVPKLTWKPTKVTTTKTVRNKEVELTLYVFDAVYCQELVPSAMLEKIKPVFDTSYKPYVSDGNQEDNSKPDFYRTTEGQLVLKKVIVREFPPDYINCICNFGTNTKTKKDCRQIIYTSNSAGFNPDRDQT